MTTATAKILLGVWNLHTRQNLTFSMAKLFKFEQWEAHREHAKFGERELIAVIAYLNGQISKKLRKPTCLNFDYIIGDPDNFEQILEFTKNTQAPDHSKGF